MTTVGSLCSGYGGLDLAVEAVFDARTVWHCEYEAAPSRVLAQRWPGVPNLGDLTAADWDAVEPVDLMTTGYPCQPFSHAGQRKGTDDDRHLWPYVAEAVRRVRPRLVVLENVAGHRSMGFDAVLGDLAVLGYDAQWCSVRASDVGAPHRRERLFILAADTRREHGQRRASAERGGAGARRPTDESQRSAASAADAANLGHERGGRAWDGRAGPADSRITAADAGRSGLEGHGRFRAAPGEGETAAHDRGAAADADRDGLQGVGRLDTLGRDADRRGSADIAWGQYEPAIRRWERTIGRVAPAPTETAPRGGQRLSARLVEWMMGLPVGWVTDVDGISRNEKLKMLGNGVVPQQAAHALRMLLSVCEVAA